jgi:hypothetical protein
MLTSGLSTRRSFPTEVTRHDGEQSRDRHNEGDWPWNGIIRFEGIDAIFTDEMTEEQSKALEAKRTAEETKRAADAYRRQTENLTEEERRLLP